MGSQSQVKADRRNAGSGGQGRGFRQQRCCFCGWFGSRFGLCRIPRSPLGECESNAGIAQLPQFGGQLVDVPPHQVQGFGSFGSNGHDNAGFRGLERHANPTQFFRVEGYLDLPVSVSRQKIDHPPRHIGTYGKMQVWHLRRCGHVMRERRHRRRLDAGQCFCRYRSIRCPRYGSEANFGCRTGDRTGTAIRRRVATGRRDWCARLGRGSRLRCIGKTVAEPRAR